MDVAPTGATDVSVTRPSGSRGETALRQVAQDLEAAFLAEMLKHTGLGAAPDGFGGGPGEAQFSSMMTQEHARLLVERGGIGLAEGIFQALTARQGQ